MTMKDVAVKKQNILFELDVKNVDEVIDVMTELLYDNGDVEDLDEFRKAIRERENEMCTNIGKQFAIPHGKSTAVLNSTVAFASLKESIIWGDEDAKYVFMMAVNEADKGDNHIRTLARLASKLMDDDFIGEIMSAENIDEVYKAVNKI